MEKHRDDMLAEAAGWFVPGMMQLAQLLRGRQFSDDENEFSKEFFKSTLRVSIEQKSDTELEEIQMHLKGFESLDMAQKVQKLKEMISQKMMNRREVNDPAAKK